MRVPPLLQTQTHLSAGGQPRHRALGGAPDAAVRPGAWSPPPTVQRAIGRGPAQRLLASVVVCARHDAARPAAVAGGRGGGASWVAGPRHGHGRLRQPPRRRAVRRIHDVAPAWPLRRGARRRRPRPLEGPARAVGGAILDAWEAWGRTHGASERICPIPQGEQRALRPRRPTRGLPHRPRHASRSSCAGLGDAWSHVHDQGVRAKTTPTACRSRSTTSTIQTAFLREGSRLGAVERAGARAVRGADLPGGTQPGSARMP